MSLDARSRDPMWRLLERVCANAGCASSIYLASSSSRPHRCQGCFNITTVFSHSQTVVLCGSCSAVLCTPTGGKARLTEGETVSCTSRMATHAMKGRECGRGNAGR